MGVGAPVTASDHEPTDGLSRRLAAFVRDSAWENIPEAVRAHAAKAIFNGVGTALGGSSDPTIVCLTNTLAAFSAGDAATVIGHRVRRDVLTAAFLNAAAMNVFDFDDTHAGTIIHPTAPIAPVVLALAETRPVSGSQLLHAFVLGVEVTCRIGAAVSPGHYDRGWHITSTCGIFGAAVAAAKLLDLDEHEIVWALGNASAQASGLVETLGFMAKSAGVGNAARGGLLSALMARPGVEGPPRPLEVPRWFLKDCCDAPAPADAADFSDAAVSDPRLRALRAKVRAVEIDDKASIDGARVTIRYSNGVSIEQVETAATGSLARPMTDFALKEKFAALVPYGCPGLDSDASGRSFGISALSPMLARWWRSRVLESEPTGQPTPYGGYLTISATRPESQGKSFDEGLSIRKLVRWGKAIVRRVSNVEKLVIRPSLEALVAVAEAR
jgi:2-methylcitrate dehydratase PrpD